MQAVIFIDTAPDKAGIVTSFAMLSSFHEERR